MVHVCYYASREVATFQTNLLSAAGDFNDVFVPLAFTTGISSLPCPIPLIDDSIIEDPETFQISLSLVNPADGSLSTSADQPSVATATITDNGKWRALTTHNRYRGT